MGAARRPCRVCYRPSALTRRGAVWHHRGRVAYGPLGDRCPGAGLPPLGEPGPDLPAAPGQLLYPPPWQAERPGPSGTVYLLCFDAPFGHARHYMGWASPGNLAARLAHHGTASGANLLWHVAKAGTGWGLVRTWAGDRREERRLKVRGGHARKCPRCSPRLAEILARRV